MSSTIFAQVEEKILSNEKPKTYIASEFERVPNSLIKKFLDGFVVELQNSPTSQGYIINYGRNKEVAGREKLFRSHLSFRKCDASRVTFVRGSNKEELKTQFWIVPEGTEPPTP